MCASERPQRKGERCENAVDNCQNELAGMQRRHDRQGDDCAERPPDKKRQGRADDSAGDAAGDRKQYDLREIDHEDAASAGAQRLHGGNGVTAPIEMALYRIADTDTADEKRGQAYDGEKLGEALNIAFETRRRVAPAADLP